MNHNYQYYMYNLNFQNTGKWNGLIKTLQEGGADMALTSLQITPNRAEAVEFTVPYLETGTAIIVSLRNDTISAYAILGAPYLYFVRKYLYMHHRMQ